MTFVLSFSVYPSWLFFFSLRILCFCILISEPKEDWQNFQCNLFKKEQRISRWSEKTWGTKHIGGAPRTDTRCSPQNGLPYGEYSYHRFHTHPPGESQAPSHFSKNGHRFSLSHLFTPFPVALTSEQAKLGAKNKLMIACSFPIGEFCLQRTKSLWCGGNSKIPPYG